MEEPLKMEEKWRNLDGTFKEGYPGGPGRPKGKTLKEYQAEQFRIMSDDEKAMWLKMHKVSGETRWKMAEGNPKQDVDAKVEVESKIIKLDE